MSPQFFSIALIVLSVVVWMNSGNEKYSVDFVGGSEVVVRFSQPIKIAQIREALKAGGFSGAVVQAFKDELHRAVDSPSEASPDFSIRLKSGGEDSGSGAMDEKTGR